MGKPYYTLLPRLFRRFSVVAARRTLVPTLKYYATRPVLPPSDKPALFTMNILPPMMAVWHHCARKHLGGSVDVVIFDCSGELDPAAFPGARVQKFLNFYAATKSEEFLYRIAKKRRIGWLCDDDVFFVSNEAVGAVLRELAVPNTASVSFRPRTWWHFEIDGKKAWPSGSYCIAFHREIFCDREKLSLKPSGGNAHPANLGKPPLRYDTGDKANEILLQKGYRCFIVPKEEEPRFITGFSGMSGAVMLLRHFKSADETLDWFRSVPSRAWSGNVIFGTFSALLAARTIQECHERITGREYPLPSLPSRRALEHLRREKEQILSGLRSFAWIDEASERLRAAL